MSRDLVDAYDQITSLLQASRRDPERANIILAEIAELIVARQLDTERLDVAARAAVARITENSILSLATLMAAISRETAMLATPLSMRDKMAAAKVLTAAKIFEATRIAAEKLHQDAREAEEHTNLVVALAKEALEIELRP